MSIGKKLRELRGAANLTQVQLAGLVGLSKSGLAYIEQGLREPGWQTVQKLAKALGVDCRAFADDEPGQQPAEDAPKRGRGRPPKEETEPPPAKKPGRKKK